MDKNRMSSSENLISARNLSLDYNSGGLFGGKSTFRAVNSLNLDIRRGENLGLVGESGCGKSSAGRLLLGLERPSAGEVVYNGESLNKVSAGRWKQLRASMQIVFQDPLGSLNPRFCVGRLVGEPLAFHRALRGTDLKKKVSETLSAVGLKEEDSRKFPHQFSGGQRQRIAIARAICLGPEFLVADEPVSALDLSVQGQIISLLRQLQTRLAMTMLFISHDLALVGTICDRVAVMYSGSLVEIGRATDVFSNPRHPYTTYLLSSADNLSRKGNLPGGSFNFKVNPDAGLREIEPDHLVLEN